MHAQAVACKIKNRFVDVVIAASVRIWSGITCMAGAAAISLLPLEVSRVLRHS